MTRRDSITEIDTALIAMRRFWSGPGRPRSLRQDVGGGVELSTVLVADAVHRRTRGGIGKGTGNDTDTGVSVAEVADQLDVTHSTASRLVERAVDAGVVQRLTHRDRRRTALALTDKGEDLVTASATFRAAHVAAVVDDWSEPELESFAALLSRFADQARHPVR